MVEYILTKITIKRLEKNYSQHYIAQKLNISQSYYNKIENGKKEITLRQLLQITEILNIDNTELFTTNTKLKTV